MNELRPSPSVALIATLDTKGPEAAFVRELLQAAGVVVRLIDAGCLGTPTVAADVSRGQVFAAAGSSLDEHRQAADRGQAITAAARGVTKIVREWFDAGQLAGVIALGGSAGTTIGTAAMRALPLGVPKLMVSTLASGQTRPWVGDKDICMLNSVVDIAGLNRISRSVLANAAAAMSGMVQARACTPSPNSGEGRGKGRVQRAPPAPALPSSTNLAPAPLPCPADSAEKNEKPLIAATMFGVTTPCVQHARTILENAGYEVLVFHATGNGGQAMESLIADGLIAGVLDLTTTELADELVGGILSAGPDRLTAAAKIGVPQVVSVGALDMVNFGPRETVPEKFRDRQFYQHNASVTLMRTTVEESRRLGEEIGRKLSGSTGPACVLLPLQGVSAIDRAGQPFDDPAARAALFAGIRSTLRNIECVELDCHINDPQFAEAAANKLMRMIDDERTKKSFAEDAEERRE